MPQEHREEEVRRIENKKAAEKKVTFTQDYNKKRGPDHGSEQWTRVQIFQKKEIRTTLTMDFGEKPLLLIRISLRDQTSHMGTTIRTREHHMINAQINHSTEAMDIDLQMKFFNNQKKNWRNIGNFSRSPVTETRKFSQIIYNSEQRSDQPKHYALRKSDNRFTTGFTPCEQEFPQNINQTSSDVVRLTTTDNAINELSDLCPLNY